MELDKTNTQVYLNYLLSQHTLSLHIIIQKIYLDKNFALEKQIDIHLGV